MKYWTCLYDHLTHKQAPWGEWPQIMALVLDVPCGLNVIEMLAGMVWMLQRLTSSPLTGSRPGLFLVSSAGELTWPPCPAAFSHFVIPSEVFSQAETFVFWALWHFPYPPGTFVRFFTLTFIFNCFYTQIKYEKSDVGDVSQRSWYLGELILEHSLQKQSVSLQKKTSCCNSLFLLLFQFSSLVFRYISSGSSIHSSHRRPLTYWRGVHC